MKSEENWGKPLCFEQNNAALNAAVQSDLDITVFSELSSRLYTIEAEIKRKYFDSLKNIRDLDTIIRKFRSFLCVDYKHGGENEKSSEKFGHSHRRSLVKLDSLLAERANVIDWHIDLGEFLENSFGYDSSKLVSQS